MPIALAGRRQFEITPKAFTNFSAQGWSAATTLGKTRTQLN